MDRDEIHTILDAVLDYIERTGGYIHFDITAGVLEVNTLDDRLIGFVTLDSVTAETTRMLIDALGQLEADANPHD